LVGPLPFTGLALITLVLLGGALVLAGTRLRRSTARREPALRAAPVAVLGPVLAAPRPAPARAHQGVGLAAVAVVGLLGLAVLASHRRA
jgi:uncharacterized membrane protein